MLSLYVHSLPPTRFLRAAQKKENFHGSESGASFDAMVINKNAPPPPELPMKTLQAIGTGPCKMARYEVSSSALNYDSSDH